MLKRTFFKSAQVFLFCATLLFSQFSPVVAQSAHIYKSLETPFYDPSSCSVEAGAVAPGKGEPDGATFPNLDPAAMANAIDKWIIQENANSKLKGLGSTIVASAKKANVNPFLIVAIAHEESSLSDPSVFNVIHGNNSFGRAATASQPHFIGARLWYKWTSVKASVDYTAEENQGAVGGGDIAAYLRNQYSGKLDNGSLTDLFLQYAPPNDNNNTTQYVANVKGWIRDLIRLSGQNPSPTPSGSEEDTASDDSCASSSAADGAVMGNIVQTAINYAWPTYHSAPYLVYKPSYKRAIDKAIDNGEYVGGLSHPGVDCGGFVTRVMRDSGADPNYNWGPHDARQGATPAQQAYMDAHPELYQRLGAKTSTAGLQPGDIAINGEHTYIFVGHQSGFHGNSASASVSFTGASWRTPMASSAYFSNSAGSFIWYRLKASPQNG